MSVVWLTTLISFVAITGIWLEFFIAWFLPVTVFYQISALLQFLSEHRWLRTRRNDETKKEHLAKLTAARFFGEPYPAYSNVFAKLLWCARMIFWHAPCRLFVCPGTLPVHDAHHRHAGTTEWANLIFVRQRDVDAGCSKWETPYMEVWGMREALDKSFEHFASLPPIVVSQNAESKTAVLGM